jgi:hypothetical protein
VRRPRGRGSLRTPSRKSRTIAFTIRASGCRVPRRKRLRRQSASCSRRTAADWRIRIGEDSFPTPSGDVVVSVVAGLRAEDPVVPRNARADGVRLGAVAIQEWISGARRHADAAAEAAGLVRMERPDNFPYERVPGERVTSDLAHTVTRQSVVRAGVRPRGSRQSPDRSRSSPSRASARTVRGARRVQPWEAPRGSR